MNYAKDLLRATSIKLMPDNLKYATEDELKIGRWLRSPDKLAMIVGCSGLLLQFIPVSRAGRRVYSAEYCPRPVSDWGMKIAGARKIIRETPDGVFYSEIKGRELRRVITAYQEDVRFRGAGRRARKYV